MMLGLSIAMLILASYKLMLLMAITNVPGQYLFTNSGIDE